MGHAVELETKTDAQKHLGFSARDSAAVREELTAPFLDVFYSLVKGGVGHVFSAEGL